MLDGLCKNIKVYLQIFYWLLRVSKRLPPMHFRQLNFLIFYFGCLFLIYRSNLIFAEIKINTNFLAYYIFLIGDAITALAILVTLCDFNLS